MRNAKAPGYRILVRLMPIEKSTEKVTESGIVYEINTQRDVELEQESMTEGWVIDIGSCAFRESDKPWCKIGDKILMYKHAGSLMKNMQDEYTYRMIQDLDIQSVFPDEGIQL